MILKLEHKHLPKMVLLIKNAKIKLDFDKYVYYSGLSSIRCNCKDCDGFQFDVEMI